MRISSCVLGAVICLVAGRAEADVSKAWAAAKDNLPANTQFVLAVDLAALKKSPLFPKVFEMVKREERELDEVYSMIKSACRIDPLSVVEGFVIAGDLNTTEGVAFLQLAIDRTRASACLESMLRSFKKGKVTVKQDGAYTVASKGTGKRDTAYFPWVGPSVVAISIKPDHKDKVDAWFGQKGFSSSKVGGVVGKLDPRATAFGAFGADRPFESSLPVTAAHGNVTIAGGKLVGTVVATATDASAAGKLAAELTKELARDIKRDRTPAPVKKIMRAISITAAGNQLTVKGTTTAKDVGDALVEVSKKPKRSGGSIDEQQAIATMDAFSKKMCSCRTKACADKINDELTKWGTEMARKQDSSKPSPDLAKRAAEIMSRYAECMTKLLMQNTP